MIEKSSFAPVKTFPDTVIENASFWRADNSSEKKMSRKIYSWDPTQPLEIVHFDPRNFNRFHCTKETFRLSFQWTHEKFTSIHLPHICLFFPNSEWKTSLMILSSSLSLIHFAVDQTQISGLTLKASQFHVIAGKDWGATNWAFYSSELVFNDEDL